MKNILILDDDQSILNSLKDWFNGNYPKDNVICLTKLSEAYDNLKTKTIDLIISDYDLGQNTKGTQIFDGKDEVNCPVIFLTGKGSKDVMKEIANNHAFSVLEKGCDLSEMEKTIKSAFEKREESIKKDKIEFIGENSATLIHEINNPLAIILGRSQLMTRKINEENIDRQALIKDNELIQDTCYRMLNLMKRTKNLINGESVVEFKEKNFVEFLYNFLEDSKTTIDREKIKFKIDIKNNFVLKLDPLGFYQVLGNLLSNSIDSFKENNVTDKEILIKVVDSGQFKSIIFEDNGPGIPPEIRSKIFTKLFTTKSGENGTGIGLNFCKNIINAHMGEMYLDENTTKARFVMKLPFIKENSTTNRNH